MQIFFSRIMIPIYAARALDLPTLIIFSTYLQQKSYISNVVTPPLTAICQLEAAFIFKVQISDSSFPNNTSV